MDIQFPEKWKEWNVKRLIGKGAYGSVYLLEKEEQQTALKVIRVPEDDAEYDLLLREYVTPKALKKYFDDMKKRLGTEIEIMMDIREHPNIVKIYDYEMISQTDGYGFSLFIQMEYLTPLPVYQEKHFLKENDFLRIGVELCSALEYCHKRQLIHRDIKPDNVFMTEEGHAKLGDFGMACYLDHNKRYMSIKGSTAYMAPEVFSGKRYDQRADLYSLAMTIYRELNRGREPFVSPTKSLISLEEKEEAVKLRLSGKKIPPPEEASLSFWKILKKALYADPNERYDTVFPMKNDMIQLMEGEFRYPHLNRRQYKKLGAIALACTTVILTIIVITVNYRISRRKKEEEIQKVQEYTVEYDNKLWNILRDGDYSAFTKDYDGYNEADFRELCQNCYSDQMDKLAVNELTSDQRENPDTKQKATYHYVEVLHYHTNGRYPDPDSRIDASRLMYTVMTESGEYYLTTEDGDLIRALVNKMPQGYQEAYAAGRNTQDYVFAHHGQDENLVFDGVAGFEITSLWQNEDRSVTARVLIMNGTDAKRIVNDMDYLLADEELGLIAEGNCGDTYEVEPGSSITFDIIIPAEEVQTGWNKWSRVETIFEPNID